MAIKLGNTDINKIYLGSTEIKKAYLGNNLIFDNTVVVIPTELLTEANAAALSNEGDGTQKGSWSNSYYSSVETTDTNSSTNSLRVLGFDTSVTNMTLTINGLTIGDEITIEFDIKCTSNNEQSFTIYGTDDDSVFWTTGTNNPLVWTSYSRTVIMTATTLELTAIGSQGSASFGDMLIDNLSIKKL